MGAIKADSVQRNQSPFKGKLGEQVASENLTIYDDGLFPRGCEPPSSTAKVYHIRKPLSSKRVSLKTSYMTTTPQGKLAKKAQATRPEQVTSQHLASTPQTSISYPATKPPSRCYLKWMMAYSSITCRVRIVATLLAANSPS